MAPEEVSPPSYAHVEELLAAITPRHPAPRRVLAETGLRSVELESLTWGGDLDFLGSELRVDHGRAKGRTAGRRWVPLPAGLLDEIGALGAPEDRDALEPVFPDATNRALGNAMARTCRHAGIPTYTPHDCFISIS
jgi:integrase